MTMHQQRCQDVFSIGINRSALQVHGGGDSMCIRQEALCMCREISHAAAFCRDDVEQAGITTLFLGVASLLFSVGRRNR
jgi:hypothetical protein